MCVPSRTSSLCCCGPAHRAPGRAHRAATRVAAAVRGIITAMTRTGPGGPPLPAGPSWWAPRRWARPACRRVARLLAGPDRSAAATDPDLQLRLRVAAEVRSLLAAYAAVIATHPATASRLRPFAADTRAHDRALERTARCAGHADPGRRAPAGAVAGAVARAGHPAAAVAWLAGLERAAAVRRRRELLRAGPDLARLLASVGASEATHAGAARPPGGYGVSAEARPRLCRRSWRPSRPSSSGTALPAPASPAPTAAGHWPAGRPTATGGTGWPA